MKKLFNDHHIYDSVSSIYDGLMDEVNYQNWADYITDIIKNFSKSNGPVLELASGTCRLAAILKNRFADIIVSDISLGMLTKSNDKNLKKICCDMTFLPVKSKFPIVISTFDSVNYLLSEKRLIRLFNEIKNILTDNGIFSFDASLYNNSLDHVRDYVSSGDVKGIVYRRNSKFNKMARIHKNIFEIVDKSKKTFKEIHKQKIYDFHKYFDLVYESGLKVVECYEAFTFKSGNAKSARVQFVVKKQSQ